MQVRRLLSQPLGCALRARRRGEIIDLLESAGWTLSRTSGSHHVFTHPEKPGHVVVPHPRKDMPLGTTRAIEKQSGVALIPKRAKRKE